MPEAFIIKRWDAEIGGLKAKWQKARSSLSDVELKRAEDIIADNDFDEKKIEQLPEKIAKYLSFYLITREEIPTVDDNKKRKRIAQFESSCPRTISKMCRDLLSKC